MSDDASTVRRIPYRKSRATSTPKVQTILPGCSSSSSSCSSESEFCPSNVSEGESDIEEVELGIEEDKILEGTPRRPKATYSRQRPSTSSTVQSDASASTTETLPINPGTPSRNRRYEFPANLDDLPDQRCKTRTRINNNPTTQSDQAISPSQKQKALYRILQRNAWKGTEELPPLTAEQNQILEHYRKKHCCLICKAHVNPAASIFGKEQSILAHLLLRHRELNDTRVILDFHSYNLTVNSDFSPNPLPFRITPSKKEGYLECSSCSEDPPRAFQQFAKLIAHFKLCLERWTDNASKQTELKLKVERMRSSVRKAPRELSWVQCPLDGCDVKWKNSDLCSDEVSRLFHLISNHSAQRKACQLVSELSEQCDVKNSYPFLNVERSLVAFGESKDVFVCAKPDCELEFSEFKAFLRHSRAHDGDQKTRVRHSKYVPDRLRAVYHKCAFGSNFGKDSRYGAGSLAFLACHYLGSKHRNDPVLEEFDKMDHSEISLDRLYPLDLKESLLHRKTHLHLYRTAFVCSICKETFTRPSLLRVHATKVHRLNRKKERRRWDLYPETGRKEHHNSSENVLEFESVDDETATEDCEEKSEEETLDSMSETESVVLNDQEEIDPDSLFCRACSVTFTSKDGYDAVLLYADHLLSKHTYSDEFLDQFRENCDFIDVALRRPFLEWESSVEKTRQNQKRTFVCGECAEQLSSIEHLTQHADTVHCEDGAETEDFENEKPETVESESTANAMGNEPCETESVAMIVKDIKPTGLAEPPVTPSSKKRAVSEWLTEMWPSDVIRAKRKSALVKPPTMSDNFNLKKACSGQLFVPNPKAADQNSSPWLFKSLRSEQIREAALISDTAIEDVSHIPGVRGFKCPACSFVGKTSISTRIHYGQTHSSDVKPKLMDRLISSMHSTSSSHHVNITSSPALAIPFVACAICYKPFTSRQAVEYHARLEHDKDIAVHSCHYCQKPFRSICRVEAHEAKYHRTNGVELQSSTQLGRSETAETLEYLLRSGGEDGISQQKEIREADSSPWITDDLSRPKSKLTLLDVFNSHLNGKADEFVNEVNEDFVLDRDSPFVQHFLGIRPDSTDMQMKSAENGTSTSAMENRDELKA